MLSWSSASYGVEADLTVSLLNRKALIAHEHSRAFVSLQFGICALTVSDYIALQPIYCWRPLPHLLLVTTPYGFLVLCKVDRPKRHSTTRIDSWRMFHSRMRMFDSCIASLVSATVEAHTAHSSPHSTSNTTVV